MLSRCLSSCSVRLPGAANCNYSMSKCVSMHVPVLELYDRDIIVGTGVCVSNAHTQHANLARPGLIELQLCSGPMDKYSTLHWGDSVDFIRLLVDCPLSVAQTAHSWAHIQERLSFSISRMIRNGFLQWRIQQNHLQVFQFKFLCRARRSGKYYRSIISWPDSLNSVQYFKSIGRDTSLELCSLLHRWVKAKTMFCLFKKMDSQSSANSSIGLLSPADGLLRSFRVWIVCAPLNDNWNPGLGCLAGRLSETESIDSTAIIFHLWETVGPTSL